MVSIHFAALPAPLQLTHPREILLATSLSEVRPVIRAAEQAAQAGAIVAGYVAYEAAPAFDPALQVRDAGELPLAWFGVYESSNPIPSPTAGLVAKLEWQPTTPRTQYDADIAAIHRAIAAGETYQVNYTLRLHAAFTGQSDALFQQLWNAQPAPYAAFLDIGRFQMLSLSPELFFHRRGGTITTRPMKGTAARGRWPEEDAAQAAWLAASLKNQAENLMIVDLLRNDLGRLAEVGSVHVARLFQIERYPTVWQMTSTVAARERAGTRLEDVFAALFPCGSVTGAPKISTMRLIHALEAEPRGVYCGAIGVILPGGEAIFNVAIRTLVVDSKRGEAVYGIGGGITADSSAADEYAEALAKAAVLHEQSPFALLETLRRKNGRYTLLEGHLQRLAASANYFNIPLDLAEVRAALKPTNDEQRTTNVLHSTDNEQQTADNEQQTRVRLLVSQAGEITVEWSPLNRLPSGPLTVALASTPVSHHDRFLFHKTTCRTVYETARRQQPDVFDVLLWNEDGELTEFTIGNLVVEIDGRCYTPPRASGLLDGVLRAALLRRGSIQERALFADDLRRATRIWLINSVRGWVEVAFKKA